MGTTIAATSLRSFVELVKIDHLLYKLDVYHVLTGASERTHSHFAEATECRLGKWYYEGEGREQYSQLDGFRAIEAPHTEFHRQGRAAVDAYHAGDTAAGSSAIEQMEKASAAVLESLERVARSGEQAAGHLVS
ncbi:CZB domain-containing protein [Propionivibrio sp. SG131]|uniref:CZB domain-containing protein n=1 Tax=Propionivibrio soli TaxID=2976531 RepID=UPI0021E848B0